MSTQVQGNFQESIDQSQQQLNYPSSGWVETGARIKPYWKSESEATGSIVSIVSADSQKPSQIVVTSRNGLKIDQARKNFKTDQEITSFRDGFKDKIETYKFDAVFNTNANIDFIYSSYFAEATKKLIAGINASFLIYGPQGAGKSYTFSGNETANEKGLIFKVCEDLLGQISPQTIGAPTSSKTVGNNNNNNDSRTGSQSPQQSEKSPKGLKVSIFSIYSDEVFDLLQTFSPNNIKQSIRELYEKSLTEVKIVNLAKRDIKSPSEFKQSYSQAIQNLLMLGEQLKEQNYYGKCHIVVQFEISKSRLSIVRLSDSDIYDTFQEPAKNDLAVLKRYLNHCSRYNEITPTFKLYKQSKLTFALRDTLNETTNNRLICCVNNNPAAFINSIKTLDYFGRMTTGIDRSILQQTNINNSRQIFDESRLSNQNNTMRQGMNNNNTYNENNISNINEVPSNMQTATKSKQNNSFLNPSAGNNNNSNNQSISNKNDGTLKNNNNGQVQNIEQIIIECEELMKEITKTSSQTARMSIKERNFWISSKQSELRSLMEQVNSCTQTTQPRQSLNYCASLIESGLRQLGRLQNSSQKLIEDSDSSDDEVQDIKQRIDRQISRLQDSQILEQERSISQEQQYKPRLSPRRIQSPPRRLTPPIRDVSMSFQNPGNNDIPTERSRISNTNQNSYIDQERSRIKEQNLRKMDFKVKETTLRNEELQEQVKAKTEVISQIDREMKNCQDDLMMNMDRLRDLQIKQENAERIEEQLRDQNETLKHKLLDKKGKVQVLKAEAHNISRNSQLVQEDLMSQVDQLKQLLENTQKSLQDHMEIQLDIKTYGTKCLIFD